MPARRAALTNRIVHRLPLEEAAVVAPLYEPFELVPGTVLCDAGAPVSHAIFPQTGIVSMLSPVLDGNALELGMCGREGMFGLPLLFGIAVSPVRALVQGPGAALRIEAAAFRRALPRCPVLADRLQRYAYVLLTQVAQTAACNGFHTIAARTARWMLSTADRMQSNEFSLTQSLLAEMLGVRRPAVSHAARALRKTGLVEYSRGRVSIVDRPGLEAASCRCYGAINALYAAALK